MEPTQAINWPVCTRHGQVENILGRLHVGWGHFESARAHHVRAHELASAMQFRSEEASALLGMARTAEALADMAGAREHLAAAAELYEFMGLPAQRDPC